MLRPGASLALLAFLLPGFGGPDVAAAQSDDARGYAAGKAACENGPPAQPAGSGNSAGFAAAWERGCQEGWRIYLYNQGWKHGSDRCRTNPKANPPGIASFDYNRGFLDGCQAAVKLPPPVPPSPPTRADPSEGINCSDPDIPRLWKSQSGCPGFGPNPPSPSLPRPPGSPTPPPGGRIVNGINCDDPEVPRLWKSQAGCPGAGSENPMSNPPAQSPTPPPGPGPVVNGINCNDPEIPRLWKTQAGCPGFGRESPEPPADPRPPAGPMIGVTLTLRFPPTEAIDGFTGYVIVPIESALQYTHRGPLPPGAIQGLAWSTGEHDVTLNTTQYSGLEAGRAYVVFLMFTGETVPAAYLELPPVTKDYIGVLAASLAGGRAWFRLAKRP